MKYGKEKGKRVDIFLTKNMQGVFFLSQVAAYGLVLYSVREQHGLALRAEKGDTNACVQNQGLNATPSVP